MEPDPRIESVTLSALIVGESVRLVDVHGKKIAVVPLRLVGTASNQTTDALLLRAKWKHAFAGMSASLNSKHKSMQTTAWKRKIQVWQASLRWRRNRVRPIAKAESNRYSEHVRPDWCRAVRALLMQYNNRLHEARLRRANPWRLWAQTVAGNHRKKGAMQDDRRNEAKENEGVGDGHAVRRSASQAAIQMRIDWR